MGFSRTKDRAFAIYDTMSGAIVRAPAPVRRLTYKAIGSLFWLAYLFNGKSVRPTMAALCQQTDGRSATAMFRGYVRSFVTGTECAERIRFGYGAEVDGLLTIPEKDRLERLLAQGGLFLALPHLHGSMAMIRGLSQSYPVLAVVSLTRNKDRAAAQRALYEQGGCEVLDVRSEDAGTVARRILRALKAGKIVAGTVDRIQAAPDAPYDQAKDVARVTAFGQAVGFGAWPTRFSAKARTPIVPAFVDQSGGRVTLILGQDTVPSGAVQPATQAWVTELERLIRETPHEWAFSVDKHWSRVLLASDQALR